MKRLIPLLVLVLTLSPLIVSAAALSVPSPSNSSIEPCLRVCPAGDFGFHIVVRDLASNPVVGSMVVIDFCGCSNVVLCPVSTTDPYLRASPCSIRQVTDASGSVNFPIRAGGVCGGAGAVVYADGVLLAYRSVASPDQNGNLIVDGPDVALLAAKIGSGDPTGDLDCDGLVTQADSDILTHVHIGHLCPPPDPTPSSRTTWGRLKTIYR